ncbi:MAG: proteasome subunit beta [Candidatus Micrarchaeota archaeon]|nr:proteasome subunit beta [Candidatus Micrarchaeota archaeon]
MDLKGISEAIKKGTTTVGIICNDGVVLGADSRGTLGDFISSDAVIKLQKIDDGLGIMYAGVAGYAEYVVKLLRVQSEMYKMQEGHSMSPSAAASLLGFILRESVSEMGYAFLIVGGLNRSEPELISLDAIGSAQKESKYTSIGSGMASALGYLDNAYSGNISVQDGVRHAAKALQVAMKRSSATGGAMRIATITKKGFKELSKDEIEKLLKAQ